MGRYGRLLTDAQWENIRPLLPQWPRHSHGGRSWADRRRAAAEANPSSIMQKLEDRTALFILKNLRENPGYAWCEKMLARVTLPPPSTIMRTFGCGNEAL